MVTITLRKPKAEEFELLADFQVVMVSELCFDDVWEG